MNTDNQQERLNFDIGWLVGVWESEGWVSLRSCYLDGDRLQRYRPEMGVGNTDAVLLDNVERVLKQLHIPYWRTKWQTFEHKKSRATIKIDGVKRCKQFLDILGPLFVSKSDRVQIVKNFIDYRLSLPGKAPYSDKEHDWFFALSQLNAPLSKQVQNPQRLYVKANSLA